MMESQKDVSPVNGGTLAAMKKAGVSGGSEVYLLGQFGRLTWRRIQESKVNYCLGFGACFLVVLVVSLLVTIINKTPVVFLRLAELEKGELDIVVESGTWTGAARLNYTLAAEVLQEQDPQAFVYNTPRIARAGLAMAESSCSTSGLDPMDRSWKYPNFTAVCGEEGVFNSELILYDSNREEGMGIGRDWTLPKLTQPGTAYVQRALANALGASKGSIIYLDISASSFFGPLWNDAMPTTTNSSSDYVIVPLTIADVFADPDGKFSTSVSSAIMVEYSTFSPFLVSHMDLAIGSDALQFLAALDMFHYADSIVINLPPPRIDLYLSSDYDIIQKDVVAFTSRAIYGLGFSQLRVSLPALDGVSDTRFFGLFLGLILNIVIVILLFLSVLLIYSLLMINVETRTFEMGVLRMLGTTRRGIIELLLFQAFSYALPSWALGLIISQLFAMLVFSGFESITGIPISARLSWDAVLLASILGLFIPIASSILPIRTALGQNLLDSLDVRHSKTKAVAISIERSEGPRFSMAILIVGVCLAAFGFGAYVLLPLSLLSFNLTLLLNLFFFLLLGMILGLVMLSLNIQHFLEKVLVAIFLFWEKSAITQVVLKNLVAHTARNRKTTIMYALSLGFIIFVNVSYSVTVNSFTYSLQQSNGVFLSVSSPKGVNISGDANRINLMEELELAIAEHPSVASFSWISVPLNEVVQDLTELDVSNIGHVFQYGQTVYCASPNLYTTTIDGFLRIGERTPSEFSFTPLEELYTVEGSSTVMLGSLYQGELELELNDHFLLKFESSTAPFTSLKQTRHKAKMFINTSPAFTFSQFPGVPEQDAVVSMSTYVRLSQGKVGGVDDIPMRTLLIRMVDQATDSDIDSVISKINEVRVNQNELSIWDYRDAVQPINTANTVMEYFFNFTTVVAMLISFFSLMSSMYTNIFEQTKEIGVLRAIGIRRGWMFRIYIFEAFILVLSSSILGLMIGMVVGYTMTIQRVLFTQLPIPLVFPYFLMGTVFASSLVFGILATMGPINQVVKQPVVQIMRLVA